jgi:DNA end-binding protein Ku
MLYPVDVDGDYDPKGDRFVEVDKEALELVSDKTVELTAAVEAEKIDALWFEKAYAVWPQPGQERYFAVLMQVLKQSGKALVGPTVLGKKSRQMVLRWSDVTETVLMHVCSYEASVRWSDVELVKAVTEEVPELTAAEQKQVDMLVSEFDDTFRAPTEDLYAVGLEELIKATAQGLPLPERKEAPEAEPVVDLMAALTASVEAVKAEKAKTEKKPLRKKVAA